MENSNRKPGWIKRVWQWWRRPSRLALGTLLLIGFVGGIIFWGGFNTGMEKANTEEFCISCHEMRNTVYQEYMETVHYNNRSGVRATCPDCHVPHEWGPKMIRKIKAMCSTGSLSLAKARRKMIPLVPKPVKSCTRKHWG